MFQTTIDFDLNDEFLSSSFVPEEKPQSQKYNEVNKYTLFKKSTNNTENDGQVSSKICNYRLGQEPCATKIVQRKFAGPAGLLHDISNRQKSQNYKENESQVLLCSQLPRNLSEEPMWYKMQKDFSNNEFFNTYNIDWIKAQIDTAQHKTERVPFLATFIESINFDHSDAYLEVVLKDLSGEITAIIDKKLYQDHKYDFIIGSVLILRNLSILSAFTSRYCLLISAHNLDIIYSENSIKHLNSIKQSNSDFNEKNKIHIRTNKILETDLSSAPKRVKTSNENIFENSFDFESIDFDAIENNLSQNDFNVIKNTNSNQNVFHIKDTKNTLKTTYVLKKASNEELDKCTSLSMSLNISSITDNDENLHVKQNNISQNGAIIESKDPDKNDSNHISSSQMSITTVDGQKTELLENVFDGIDTSFFDEF